jgi:pyruvate ferredoxin oxidoreductase alpha subunit
MDRAAPGGQTGLLYNDVAAALFNTNTRPQLTNIIYGLGGRDINVENITGIYNKAFADLEAGKVECVQRFVGVRGPELKYYNV